MNRNFTQFHMQIFYKQLKYFTGVLLSFMDGKKEQWSSVKLCYIRFELKISICKFLQNVSALISLIFGVSVC